MTTGRRYRCRCCGVVLSAWFPVPGEPNGAMLLNRVAQVHPAKLGLFLERMRSNEDIGRAAAEAFDTIEDPGAVSVTMAAPGRQTR